MTLDDVKRETQEDEILKKVVYSVKQQEPLGKEVGVQEYASVMSDLSVIDGVLLRGERLVVPKKLQEKVVEITHEGLQGITKTKSYLRSRLWFPGLAIMTERIIRGCRLYQIATLQTARIPLKMTPLPNETMEKVVADFYGPLPTGEYLLLVTCKYSRYPFIEVVNSTSAWAVIPKFERIFSEFGYPSEIMADNGPPFRSQKFRDYAAECGFQVRNITPAEPQVNGQAERFQGRVYTTRGTWHFLRAGPQNFAFSIDYNLEIYLILSINRSDVAFALHIATLLKSETKLETRVVYINLVFEIFYL